MLVRLALVAVACVAMAFGVARLRDHHRCDDAREAIVSALFAHREPAGGLALQRGRLEASCRDATDLASVSTVLTIAGRRGPALELARRATREEPQNQWGWIALAQALDRSDPAGAAAARRRARALNPLGRVPRAIGAGAPG